MKDQTGGCTHQYDTFTGMLNHSNVYVIALPPPPSLLPPPRTVEPRVNEDGWSDAAAADRVAFHC